MGKALLVGLAALLAAASAAADPIRLDDPDVLRLVREVYPDLGADGKASRYKGVRVLPESVDAEADKPAAVELDLGRASASQTMLTAGAARYLMVMVEGALIAAQAAPGYRFLDAVAAQTDPGGPPGVSDAFMIAADAPAILVRNAHHNSQEGFADYMLLGLVDGRLAPVYRGLLLYSVQYADATCEEKVVVQRLERFAPLATRHGGFADLALTAVEEEECRNAGKPSSPAIRRIDVVLTWAAGAGKYLGGEIELATLSRPR
jgi:hypothetical protein